MSILQQEITDNTDLMQILSNRGVVIDGAIGDGLIKSLVKNFPTKVVGVHGIALESQQIDSVKHYGAWQVLSKMDGVNLGGLVYVARTSTANAKDMVRFCDALQSMDQAQRANTMLVLVDDGQLDDVFATALSEVAAEYGVPVVSRVDEIAAQLQG